MTDIPDEAVEAAAGVRATIKTGYGEYAGPIGEDIARRALTSAAPLIAAQATRDVRAERDSILRRIERLHNEDWWIGGAWGDYGEAVIPLRALSTLTGPLADKTPEWETDPGFATTWADLRATVERQESELSELRGEIEKLRDDMRVDAENWRNDVAEEALEAWAGHLDALLGGT